MRQAWIGKNTIVKCYLEILTGKVLKLCFVATVGQDTPKERRTTALPAVFGFCAGIHGL